MGERERKREGWRRERKNHDDIKISSSGILITKV